MANAGVFHRTELASAMANQILQTSPTSASTSGIFLAAPRRTGKSTFAREDLRPAVQARGALVVYVDLWADRQADPGDVLVAAVRAALAKREPALLRLAKGLGIAEAKAGGVQLALDRIGLGKDVSLTQALAALSDDVKAPIVMVIDEAQHAITTQGGSDALFALKAARDELNSSAHHGLRVVCTGSNRDKLAMLRNSKEQAFFGAPLVRFPHLGKDYVAWFCDNAGLDFELDVDQVAKWFEQAGYRPEILGAAADAIRFDFVTAKEDKAAKFGHDVEQQIELAKQEVLRVVHSLTPLQMAVLVVMASQAEDYAPFEATTMGLYKKVQQSAGQADADPAVASVQAALNALQEKGLVWKAARGVYALEDSALADLLDEKGLLPERSSEPSPTLDASVVRDRGMQP